MSSEENERKRYLKWAGEYSRAAKMALDSKLAPQVIGHLNWVGVELSLKALAVGHTMPQDHELDAVTNHLLGNHCVTHQEYANELKPLYAHITGSAASYSEARYPGKNPGYWDNVTSEQLEHALDAGSSVHEFVKKKLNISVP